jgi:hypothetical protein
MENKRFERCAARLSEVKRGWRPYAAIGAALTAFHVFYDPTVSGFLAGNMRLFLLLAAAALVVFGAVLYFAGMLTYRRAAVIIMAVGFVIRLMYALYTGPYTRQHDVGDINGSGHWGYIYRIASAWSLPEGYHGQFYHPPLHHFLMAVLHGVNGMFRIQTERGLESLQYLTVFYSSCLMAVSCRLFRKLKLDGPPFVIAVAVTALHPTMFILGGSVNNDCLGVLLFVSALLWLIRWNEEQSVRNTVYLALCVGLGMMTKTNNALLAFIIAPFMVYKLVKSPEKRNLVGKLGLFGALSVPLGMWHPIRQLVKFNQPFGYVMRLGTDIDQYVGNVSVFKRFVSLPVTEIFKSLYMIIPDDYNLWVNQLKCSIFGEYGFNADMDAIAAALTAFNFCVIVLSLAAMVVVALRIKTEDTEAAAVLLLAWAVQMGFFVYFNVSYPFACTMDTRYIVPVIFTGAGFLGMAARRALNREGRAWNDFWRCAAVSVGGFSVFSALFYLLV